MSVSEYIVAKYTLNGDLKWENKNSDCNLDWVTRSESASPNNIIHLTHEGKLYLAIHSAIVWH